MLFTLGHCTSSKQAATKTIELRLYGDVKLV